MEAPPQPAPSSGWSKASGRTCIGPWFRVDIPRDVLRDPNTLEVAVSNLMANRVADLDRRGVVWKKFYNINFPARLGTNRAPDGLFSAAK